MLAGVVPQGDFLRGVADFLRMAVITAQHVTTQHRGAALLNGRHDFELPQAQMPRLRPSPCRTVSAEDIRHRRCFAVTGMADVTDQRLAEN